jgi:uncharacterized membrane protein YccC
METTTFNTAAVRRAAIQNGLIWGAISIVLFLVFYYIAPSLLGSWIGTTITLLVGIGLAVFFCLDLRTKAGGYWSFSQALLNIFIMFLISTAISYFFTIIFSKYIEPEYAVKMKDMMMRNMESTFKSVGMESSQLDEKMSQMSAEMDKTLNPNFSQMVVGFGISATLYFIGALIFAAIFKKERPLFFKTEE